MHAISVSRFCARRSVREGTARRALKIVAQQGRSKINHVFGDEHSVGFSVGEKSCIMASY